MIPDASGCQRTHSPANWMQRPTVLLTRHTVYVAPHNSACVADLPRYMVHRNISDMETVVAEKPVSNTAPVKATKPVVVKPAAAKPLVARAAATVKKAASAAPKSAPKTHVAAKAIPTQTQGNTVMNDTIAKAQEAAKTFAADTTERATAMFGDMNVRAKDAMAKGSKAVEEMVEFSKGNLEAMVASGRVAAKGAQDIAKYSADYGRKSIEDATATAKKFAGVKSPTEFFQLQSEVAKTSLDAFVGEASKFTESYLKLMGEVMQPVQNRVAVAVEKVKTTVAA
jgi:phasin family protein